MNWSSRWKTNLAAVALVLVSVAAAQDFPVYRKGSGASRPPLEVVYAFQSEVRGNPGAKFDSLSFEAVVIEEIDLGDVTGLLGLNARGFVFGTEGPVLLPDQLISGSLVVGAEWQWNDRWRVRIEALPGLYGDFTAVDSGSVNVPLTGELTYRIRPLLEVGLQWNVDVFREFPVLVVPGLRWQFADRWVAALWIPRPQVEFHPDDNLTLYAGANLTGGSYRVNGTFGSDFGRPEFNGTRVDYREVRAGLGLRYSVENRWAAEIATGWTVERRARFHERDVTVRSDGAPYVQISFGLLR